MNNMRNLQKIQAMHALNDISIDKGLNTEIIINDDNSILIRFAKGERIFPGDNLSESFWYASDYLSREV